MHIEQEASKSLAWLRFTVNKCNERFENFLKLHDVEVNRLKGNKNLSSIAI